MQNVARDPGDLSLRVATTPPLRQVLGRGRPRGYDASFLLFGPDYGAPRARRRILGFADGTSLFPELARTSGRFTRIRTRASRASFRRADLVVVEAPHVADELAVRWGLSRDRLRVVPNALNGVFADPASWAPVDLPDDGLPKLCFPTRSHPHKNLAVLGAAADRLRASYDLDVRFVLTLTGTEWYALDEGTRRACVNVGPVTVSQLPTLYRACQGAVFPSLLESFSVTPLEALATGTPLVASDRRFVRDLTQDAAWYFEPTRPDTLAEAVAQMLTSPDRRRALTEAGLEIATGWPSAHDRAVAYLRLVAEQLGDG
jgi:glycosyltransferase involved in cell wall biosynthesis